MNPPSPSPAKPHRVVPAVVLGLSLLTAGVALPAAVHASSVESTAATNVLENLVPAEGVSLDQTELTLAAGSTQQLKATLDPSDSTDSVTWKSSDDTVATVASNGTVSALKAGSATITAKAGDAQAVCDLTVWQPVTSIDLNRAAFPMEAGEVRQLVPTCLPDDATNKAVTWSSSDPSVAAVDAQTGLVTGVAEGSATITATAADGAGAKESCLVQVTNNAYAAKTLADFQSPHPYANGTTDSWSYTLPGAERLAVTFDQRTQVENTFDYLCIFDGSGSMLKAYTGTELAGATIEVPGDTVRVQLIADDQVDGWGFAVTDIEAMEAPAPQEPAQKPAEPQEPSEPDKPSEPDTPEDPDVPGTPADPWNVQVNDDGTVTSTYADFSIPQLWLGQVGASLSNPDGQPADQVLLLALEDHPDLALASYRVVPSADPVDTGDAVHQLAATWDNGAGQRVELWTENWAAAAYDGGENLPDDEVLGQLVNLCTGGTMTLDDVRAATETPAATYAADALVPTTEVPLYDADGAQTGTAEPEVYLPQPSTPAEPADPSDPSEPADPDQGGDGAAGGDQDGSEATGDARPGTETPDGNQAGSAPDGSQTNGSATAEERPSSNSNASDAQTTGGIPSTSSAQKSDAPR